MSLDPRRRARSRGGIGAPSAGPKGRRPILEALEPKTLLTYDPTAGFLTGAQAGSPLDIALNYVAQHGAEYGFSASDADRLKVTDFYTDSSAPYTSHIYLRQGFDGVLVDNVKMSVNVTSKGEVINVGGSFDPLLGPLPSMPAPNSPTLSAEEAVAALAPQLGYNEVDATSITETSVGDDVAHTTTVVAPGLSLDDIPAHLAYVMNSNGSLSLTWDLVVRTPDGDHWYDAHVDANTGELLDNVDWVDNYTESYTVFGLPVRSPDYGGRTSIADPADPIASPYGWLDTNGVAGPESQLSQGNNATAYEDTANANAPGKLADGGTNHNFDFPLDLTQAPSAYQPAAITDLFYWTNISHDIHYHYGFTEAAGNFQFNNYGNGGLGGDAVNAEAQDGGGVDNANFATPPDGQAPRTQMYVFDLTNPNRDGDLDPEIMLHEYGHGVSNRLTGGPSDAGALTALQSGGMGEGWSDWWGTMILQLPTDTATTPRPSGTYVLGQPTSGGGVRRYPYSTDMKVDPLTINDFNANGANPSQEVHDVGEIWCTTLWDMTWNLIAKYGYSSNLYSGYSPGAAGNILALQLVMDGLKLQPANPSFKDARDAILKADQVLNGGADLPEIWKAFAKRGMGLSFADASASASTVTPATDIPIFLAIKASAPTGVKEGIPFTDVTVGTITDPNGGTIADYTATISWGDGTTEAGTLVPAAAQNTFLVKGSHTYLDGGNYQLKVSVVKAAGGGSATDSTTVIVIDSPITGTVFPIAADEGTLFSGVLAHFVDADPNPTTIADYSVTIDWPDGTTSGGIVTANPSGGFDVSTSHVLGAGNFSVRVHITDVGGGLDLTVPAVINDLPINVFVSTIPPIPLEGQLFNGVIATFIDDDPRHLPASHYLAIIDYGDGTTGTGTVAATPFGYDVLANHAFNAGDSKVKVTISDFGTSTDTVEQTISTLDAPIVAKGIDFSTVEGQQFSSYIATFVDSDHRPHDGSWYSVKINWGDGVRDADGKVIIPDGVSNGTVYADGQGGYLVFADYKYQIRADGSSNTHKVTLTITDNIGASTVVTATTTTATLQATVADAPLTTTGVSSVQPTVGVPFVGVVATFKDANPNSSEGDYLAEIHWGDGNTSFGTVAPDGKGGFTVTGTNTYVRKGAFPISVTVSDLGGSASTGSTTAVVPEAPISAAGLVISENEKSTFSGAVAGFSTPNPLAVAGDFSAQISWGDGTTTTGTITPMAGGGFAVVGSHAYPASGVYTISATVVSGGGASASAQGTAAVAEVPILVTGGLAGQSNTGTGVITNQVNPTFSGRAEAGSTVQLFAQPVGSKDTVPIGSAKVGADGTWTIRSSNILDGRYSIIASDTDPQQHVGPATTLVSNASPLTVDTQGPKVSGLALNARTGQISFSFADGGSGLNAATLLNGSNYSVQLNTRQGLQSVPLTGLSLASSTPGGPLTVVGKIATGRRSRASSYVVTIRSGGVADNAGNTLDERFFVPFPSTYTAAGQNFVAQIDSNGQTATTPHQFIPATEIAAAAAHQSFIRSRLRLRRSR